MSETPRPPAVLFWFYRDPALCENRLRMLRRFNPGCRIFGLYGGPPTHAAAFEDRLNDLLDDFYAFDNVSESWWKWINGDLVIRTWYAQRGRGLEWDAILIVQWDMLLLGSLETLLGRPASDEVILSGLRRVAEVQPWWAWVNGSDRPQYDEFMSHLETQFGYGGEAWCCQFVFVCLGRQFLEAYLGIEEAELGFIEYRVPTYARVFGMRVSAPRFPCWWEGDPEMLALPPWRRILSAQRRPVPTHHLLRVWATDGAAIVHPYHRPFPLDVRSSLAFVKHGLAEPVGHAVDRFRRGTP
jgi:hypothetical protein